MSIETELAALVAKAQAGDRTAYESLLKRLAADLRGHVRRLLSRAGPGQAADAEDVLQEILIAVHTRLHTYDPSRPASAWVHAIARHKVIDHLRAGARSRGAVPLEAIEEVVAAPAGAPGADFDAARVLAALPGPLRAPFAAVKLEGHSIAEAAAAHGMTETALKVAIHRGMRRLSAIFAG
ncbi:sigma-70 family RNA polymerase sigma factor [Prosthecomicrobium sp. N25]|uniref:sigma-70 family RNA polymerase sigma factor n=1 Tax=Prosthecomicrobium sp. N25 TaxID=3129254 RepID=UPI003076AF70